MEFLSLSVVMSAVLGLLSKACIMAGIVLVAVQAFLLHRDGDSVEGNPVRMRLAYILLGVSLVLLGVFLILIS